MRLPSLLVLLSGAALVGASTQSRTPLHSLAVVEDANINTNTHRVNALSSFDLTFDLYDHAQHFKLRLEPNNEVIAHDAAVTYLTEDGSIDRVEPINRLHHKVYKGSAQLQREDGSWATVGWARVTVERDGPNPIFEGAFTVDLDNHHIESRASYMRTKHQLDPDVEPSGDEFMIVWRTSDIMEHLPVHSELKRDAAQDYTCLSDQLGFNKQSLNRRHTPMLRRDQSHWGAMSVGALFGKRQIDTQPGSGNTGGVNLASTIGQTAGCPSTRKVALIGVATDCGYTNSFPSDQEIRANVIRLMNSASSVWESTFNISLGLQNLTISPPSCPSTPQLSTKWNQACDSSANIYTRLNTFSEWRGTLQDRNSHWTLLTSCNTGSAVGLAWLGQACINTAMSSNVSGTAETVSGANVVAITSPEWEVIAHETGHTYGAVHDCMVETCQDGTSTAQQCCPLSKSTCPAGHQFIMNPYILRGVRHFSPCTVGEICSAIGRNSVNTSCLVDNVGVVSVSGSTCGNGIVEKGEECDCGTVEECGIDPCCNPQTCKFNPGAVCDDTNDACCKGCQLAKKNTVCRPSTGQCDPAEYCTGDSPLCPKDKTAPDGRDCSVPGVTSAGTLQCASGQCTSRDYQCQTVMGSYNHAGNNTYACDSETCQISCASPAFGEGMCYGLKQNFLDGTPCGSGGTCTNGQCEGSSFGQAITSWIDDHKGLVIGVAATLGALLVLAIASCLWRSHRRRVFRRRMAARKPSPNASWYGPPPPPPPPPPMTMLGQHIPPPYAPAFAAPPSYSVPHPYLAEHYGPSALQPPPIPPIPRSHQQQQTLRSSTWGAPRPGSALYGNGIIGNSRRSWSPTGPNSAGVEPDPPSPASPGPPDLQRAASQGQSHDPRPMWGRQLSLRYA